MNIFVNGSKVDYTPLFPLTWGTFFQKLLQSHIPPEHGIVELFVDGVESIKVMTDQSEHMMPETVGEVKITTQDSLAITKNGLTKASTLIDSIKKETMNAADFFREGKYQDASGKLASIMEAIKPLINFLHSVGMSFNMNFDEIMFDPNTTLSQKIESFLQSFGELVVAQQKKDYVELADYLEYQLVEDMDDWNKIINVLLQEAEAYHSKHA